MKPIDSAQKHHLRDRILQENILEDLDKTKLSERNKDICRRYAAGASYKELAELHSISQNRIGQIISDCVSRVVWQRKTEE